MGNILLVVLGLFALGTINSKPATAAPSKTPKFVPNYYEYTLVNGTKFHGVLLQNNIRERKMDLTYFIRNEEKAGEFSIRMSDLKRIKTELKDGRINICKKINL